MRLNNTVWGVFDKVVQIIFAFFPFFFIGRCFNKNEIGAFALSMMLISSVYMLSVNSARSIYIKYAGLYGLSFNKRFIYPFMLNKFFVNVILYSCVAFYLYYVNVLNLYTFIAMIIYLFVLFEDVSWDLERIYKQNIITYVRIFILSVGMIAKLLCIYFDNLSAVLVVGACEVLGFYVFLKLYVSMLTGDDIKRDILIFSRGSRNKSISYNSYGFFFKKTYPLLLSGFMIFLYGRVDQVMISSMLGIDELADYSLAQKLIEPLSIIPMAICATALPFIMSKKSDANLVNDLAKGYFFISVSIGVLLGIIMLLLGGGIAEFLFGSQFSSVQKIISISAFTIPINFIAIFNGMLLIIFNLQKMAPIRSLFGVIINITCNFIFIPMLGVIGASISSFITILLSGCLFYYFTPQSKPIAHINFFGLSAKHVKGLKL